MNKQVTYDKYEDSTSTGDELCLPSGFLPSVESHVFIEHLEHSSSPAGLGSPSTTL